MYLTSNRSNRLKLLAGLIDTDGYVQKANCINIISKYEHLATDIAFLARSLGFAAYISEVQKSCTNCVDTSKRPYFSVNISGDLSEIPCVLARKICDARTINKDPLAVGFKIEDAGYGDYYGFEIDGNRRFLLGDFTVTHNTRVGVIIAGELLARHKIKSVLIVTPKIPLLKQ